MSRRSAFLGSLLLILVFALAALHRYGKGGEPPALLFPSDTQLSQSVETDADAIDDAASDPATVTNPIITTVKTLVGEQQAMVEDPADGMGPSAKAQDLVDRAERLISPDGAEPASAATQQPIESTATLQSDDAYQQRLAEISHLRRQLAEMKAKQQPSTK